jgi:hypothetical protein
METPVAFCEPCYCDRCDGTPKFLGEPCSLCGEARYGCVSISCPWCPVEILSTDRCACGEPRLDLAQERCVDCWLLDFRQRYRGAVLFQSLWRGYKTRKDIQRKNAEDIEAAMPLWRFYDEQYKMYALCQTLFVDLKKDDPDWDATKTPYYVWMMERGPILEECETWLLRRGWVRPKKGRLNPSLLKPLLQGVLSSCGVTGQEARAVFALVDAFVKHR